MKGMKESNVTRLVAVAVVAASLGFCGKSLGAVSANAFETVRTNVAEEATLDHATLGGSATLVKDGAGTLDLNLSKVTASSSSAILVANGAVNATLDGAGTARPMESALTPPATAVAKLGLWLDASLYDSRPELFVGASEDGHAYVGKWLDVRETDPANPTLKHAVANFNTSWSGELTEFVRFNGRTPSIWFGGYGSGRCMNVVQGSAQSPVSGVRHVFAVHVIDDSFGFIFGNVMHIGGWGGKGSTLANPWWIASGGLVQMFTGNFYVNGVLTDGMVEHPEPGLQMMEYDFGLRQMNVSEFFRDGNNYSQATGYRAGGGYLCEVMFFTDRLTEGERRAVGDYLARKWGVAGRSPSLATASGAALSLQAGNAALQDVALAGAGVVAKNGSETLSLRSDTSAFAGQLRLNEGRVRMAAPIPLELRDGDRVTATSTDTWPETSVVHNSVESARIVKEGDATVHLTSLPPAVKKLDVMGGAVHFDAPNEWLGDAGDFPEVAIANPSFEEWGGDENSWERRVNSGGVDGWYCQSGARQIDYDNWTGAGLEGATMAQWLFNDRPPDGKRAALLYGGGSDLYTSVTIAADGDYELSMAVSGRQQFNYVGGLLDVSLTTGDSTAPLYDFGRVVYCWTSGYERIRLRAEGVKAGSYRLYFRVERSGGPLLVDDIRLHRVPVRNEKIWRIPNGDFERANFTGYSQVSSMANVTADGWSFLQPDGYEGDKLLVGLTTFYLRWDNGEYFLANTPDDASRVQLYFRCGDYRNGRAVATFTPPAGTWYVRADAGRYMANKAKLRVTARVGDGEATNLGTREITVHKMTPHYWPTPFTVDGTQQVSLEIVFSGSDAGGTKIEPGCMVDNVVLSRWNPDELVANGSFEDDTSSGAGWTKDPASTDQNRWAASPYPSDDPADDVAARPPNGNRLRMTVVNRGVITQTVCFGDDGWHELSWWAHRIEGQADQTVRGWIAGTDAVGNVHTNEIGRATAVGSAFYRHSFLFRPPSAGTYTLGLEGVNTTGSVDPGAECIVDCISLKSAALMRSDCFPMDEDLVLRVAGGARIHLGFQGTNAVKHVVLGGRGRSGIVSAQTDPDYVTGPGALLSGNYGIAISFR